MKARVPRRIINWAETTSDSDDEVFEGVVDAPAPRIAETPVDAYTFVETNDLSDNSSMSLATLSRKMMSPHKLRDLFEGCDLGYPGYDAAVERVVKVLEKYVSEDIASEVRKSVNAGKPTNVHVAAMDITAMLITYDKGYQMAPQGPISYVEYTHPYTIQDSSQALLPITPICDGKARSQDEADDGIDYRLVGRMASSKHCMATIRRSIPQPKLLPLRSSNDIASGDANTVVLIDDVSGHTVSFVGVRVVTVHKSQSPLPPYLRFAVNFDQESFSEVDFSRFTRVSLTAGTASAMSENPLMARYVTPFNTIELGAFIERKPLDDNILICHCGDMNVLGDYLLKNTIGREVSKIAQAATSSSGVIRFTGGGGGRYPVNARAGLAGAMQLYLKSLRSHDDKGPSCASLLGIDRDLLKWVEKDYGVRVLLAKLLAHRLQAMQHLSLTSVNVEGSMVKSGLQTVPAQARALTMEIFRAHVKVYLEDTADSDYTTRIHFVLNNKMMRAVFEQASEIVNNARSKEIALSLKNLTNKAIKGLE